ncbi:Uncharacterized conserved protein PhnB, glyoxalase superfamily [Nocardioides terrae]|uniref:Uncharacterized conserved protein PhnB, glyoxalase superfamily n=1 Tax=Nocardioides terrae TaxID=574651 RepID=A0A1I1P471_9ACTN|nr:VOC family protein [Nocardioides terrae]SFD02488.1 Uncharacterized conserved protein PhnB, glyoxalase superfamily [Nocardioides terrae]
MARIGQLQVNLFCDDVDGCLAFYQQLGLQEAFRAPSSGPIEHVEVEAAGVRIGLTSARVANSLVGLGVGPSDRPSTEVVFWCDDVDAMFELALSAGAASVVPPMDSPDGRLQFGWVRDPDGHQVKFVQKRADA